MGENIPVFEVSLDLKGLLSVLKPLFGREGILPDKSLEDLLRLPVAKLLQHHTAIETVSVLTSTEKENVRNMQAEVRNV